LVSREGNVAVSDLMVDLEHSNLSTSELRHDFQFRRFMPARLTVIRRHAGLRTMIFDLVLAEHTDPRH
jgi:hypothetical protein